MTVRCSRWPRPSLEHRLISFHTGPFLMRGFRNLYRAPCSHPLPYARRYLTTFPKPTPTYVKAWNAAAHRPCPNSDPPEPSAASRDTEPGEVATLERQRLRDTQTVRVSVEVSGLEQKHAIERLNKWLRRADAGPKPERVRFGLWRAYCLAKSHIPGLATAMPDRAWDVLWTTQADGVTKAQTRIARIEKVYRDMYDAGKSATVGQRAAYLESIFLRGGEEEALKEWEMDHSDTNALSRQDYKPEHLEVGVKLHALAGNAQRARQVMDELFALYPTWDPSIMINVLRAYTDTTSLMDHDQARTIYRKIKERMGDKMTLNDYDACFVGFLEARHLPYAQQVFRDMVKNGHLAASYSPQETHKVLTRLHMLYRLGVDIEKMTSIALQSISTLPHAYFFHIFSHWMRSAVVKKAPEAAVQILDMMFKLGHEPATVHFNLLLKALLRTKDEPRILKAENIGWHMIENARKSAQKKLPREEAPDMIASRVAATAKMAPIDDAERKVPVGNVTTFALLMQHHANNLQWEHVDYLIRQWKETGLQPNSQIMNVLMDKACRQGKYADVWKTYKSLTDVAEQGTGVFPDGASMRCLWKTLRLALGDHITRNDADLPKPRELLAETVQWWGRCKSRHDAEQFRMGLAAWDHGAVTSLMMHCFSYTQDFAGSLVALFVLGKHFGIFPTDNAAAILQRQAAWVDMHRQTDPTRLQYNSSKVNTRNLAKMGRVYHILMERRFERMNITGDQFAYMSKEEVGTLGLNLLSEFVRVILKRSYPPEAVEEMIEQAKEEVGVPDMPIGDMNAFDVA